jgi:hypothetical protein
MTEFLHTFDDATGEPFVRSLESLAPAASADSTYTGMQRIGIDNSITFVTDGASITTDLDFTNADWAVIRVTESTDRKSTFWLRLNTAATTERHGLWMYDTWFGEFKIINKAAGTVSVSDTNISLSVDLIETWANAANGYVTPSGSTILKPRNITGDITGVGYDNVALAYAYDLPPGRRLATVVATGGAIVSIANPLAGIVNVTPKGANTAITVTTEVANTFTGLQQLGEYRVTTAVDIESGNLIATGLNMSLADKLHITLQHSSTGAFQSSGTVYPTYSDFVIDLAQLRGAANGYAWLPLEGGYVQMRVMNFANGDLRWEDQTQGAQFIAASVWAEAANGYYMPAGTALASPRTITATLDGVATTLNGDASVIRAEGSTAMLRLPLAANRRLSSVSVGFIESPESGIVRVNVGAANIAIVATSEIYRRSVTANVNVNGGTSATVEANVPTVIQLEVPNNYQVSAVTATNGTARQIGGAGAVEVIPNNAGDMALTATLAALSPNLADTSLGTIDGSDSGSAKFVQNRAGARIKEMTFTFRDRRPEQTARNTAVTVPANAFGGVAGTNWTLRFENSFRYGISRTYSLGGADYVALVQWAPLPTGYMFWFQEAHSNAWNTYGRFENVSIKWEAA